MNNLIINQVLKIKLKINPNYYRMHSREIDNGWSLT